MFALVKHLSGSLYHFNSGRSLKTVRKCSHSWYTLGTYRKGVLWSTKMHFTRALWTFGIADAIKIAHYYTKEALAWWMLLVVISSRQCWITEWSWPCKYLGTVFELGIVDMRIREKLLSVHVIHYKPCHSQQSLGFQLNWVSTCTSEVYKKRIVCVDMVK